MINYYCTFKELLGSLVEGVRQALQVADMADRTVALLGHCVWNICHLLQQFPHLLDYAIQHNTVITDTTLCILAVSTGDPAISLETSIPVKFYKLLITYDHIWQCFNFLEHNSYEKFYLFPYDYLSIAYSS